MPAAMIAERQVNPAIDVAVTLRLLDNTRINIIRVPEFTDFFEAYILRDDGRFDLVAGSTAIDAECIALKLIESTPTTETFCGVCGFLLLLCECREYPPMPVAPALPGMGASQ